jgi:hypothetical protein
MDNGPRDLTLSQDFGALGTLFGTSSGDGTGNGRGSATFTLDFVITGGTASFSGATGEVTVTGTITQSSATTESIDATYLGSFTQAPEPVPFVLTLAGMAAFTLFRPRPRRCVTAA